MKTWDELYLAPIAQLYKTGAAPAAAAPADAYPVDTAEKAEASLKAAEDMLQKIKQSPGIPWLDRAIKNAKNGPPGLMFGKLNPLLVETAPNTHPVGALYQALKYSAYTWKEQEGVANKLVSLVALYDWSDVLDFLKYQRQVLWEVTRSAWTKARQALELFEKAEKQPIPAAAQKVSKRNQQFDELEELLMFDEQTPFPVARAEALWKALRTTTPVDDFQALRHSLETRHLRWGGRLAQLQWLNRRVRRL